MLEKVDSDYERVVKIARRNLPQVRENISGSLMYKYLGEWEKALDDKKKLKELIADESSIGYDLWQINPLYGVFTQRERAKILRTEI